MLEAGDPAPAFTLTDGQGRPVSLLSDPGHETMRAYGAFGEKTLYGRKSLGVIRSTVWIGPDGRVRRRWARVADAAQHPAKVLAAVRAGD